MLLVIDTMYTNDDSLKPLILKDLTVVLHSFGWLVTFDFVSFYGVPHSEFALEFGLFLFYFFVRIMFIL